ncbi:hypothetical protein [Alteripontixanthobacter maritimus]|uniref:hypothetical protein n=1 Tax=Alteripontixanthobacter maritimus TaxID=2161824 RepID=UPI000E1B75DB|nr:hypothetical protein [Alteripontixanthobacter maritimus]
MELKESQCFALKDAVELLAKEEQKLLDPFGEAARNLPEQTRKFRAGKCARSGRILAAMIEAAP